MKILIADDHELIREGIKRLLGDSFKDLQRNLKQPKASVSVC